MAALATAQHGVVSLDQLRDAGFSRRVIAVRVRHGRLHRIHRAVYAVGHRALAQEGQCMAAVLACGDGAVLSHIAAASLWEMWPWPLCEIHVSGPRRVRLRGVHTHVIQHDPTDITTHRGIPVTIPPRTIVDLAGVLPVPDLVRVLKESDYRNRFSEMEVLCRMSSRGGRGATRLLDALACYASGSAGTRSRLEYRAYRSLVQAGMQPRLNVPVQVLGETLEVDLVFERERVCIEIDGPGHGRAGVVREDARRDRLLREAGWKVLRFDRAGVGREGYFVAQVRNALRDGRNATV
jgi:very-short-patch-repair endonuclease